MSSEAVRIEGLAKSFSGRRSLPYLWRRPEPLLALKRVDLSIDRGELVALLGPNGAGKTTLLKILATLVAPTEGSIWILGREAGRNTALARRSIGYVLADDRSFFWRLSAEENLLFFATLVGLPRTEGKSRAKELAGLLGLRSELGRSVGDLSSGQRQRLAIARGLLADPPVLLFDEATRSLDPGRAHELRRLVRRVLVEREKKAVLFATHDLAEAQSLSDRVVLLVRGEVAARGTYGEVEAALSAAFAEEAAQEQAELDRILGGTG